MDQGSAQLPQDSAGANAQAHDLSLVSPDVANPVHWTMLIQHCNPATLLVLIEARMGDLAAKCGSSDILQEALLRAWEARTAVQWRGQRAFRSWLLTVIDSCISDARDWHNAAKRGSGKVRPFGIYDDSRQEIAEPSGSTTPSRVVLHQEQASIMKQALADLPDEVRQIIHLRLFEQLTLQQIAERVDLPFATVQHRVRRGAVLYRDRLRSALALSSQNAHTMRQALTSSGNSQKGTPSSSSDSVS